MVGFAHRASIQTLSYELGTLQHHISPAMPATDGVPHSALAVARKGPNDAGCEVKL